VKENRRVTVNERARSGDYIEKWSQCVPFVFNILQDKKYLRFSFDSPSYILSYFLSYSGLILFISDTILHVLFQNTDTRLNSVTCIGLHA
jgi:hypothetical protein